MLKEIGVLDEDAKLTNCALHGMQKALENAAEQTMGKQGLGTRVPTQMLFTFSSLMKGLHDIGGIKTVDDLWSKVTKKLKTDGRWQKYGGEKFSWALKEFLQKAENFDEEDPEQLKLFEKFMNESPRGVQAPVWTRWQSVSTVCACVVQRLFAHLCLVFSIVFVRSSS